MVNGQILIGGNVYGGGNKGKVQGNTSVTVRKGDIGAPVTDEERPLQNPRGRVFGGARMADVGGRSYVNIDGKNASGYIVINKVFGGNDIAGHIGTGDKLPDELTAVINPTEAEVTASGKTREQYIKDYKKAHPEKDTVDISWNSFVHLSSKTSGNEKIFIGQAYAGGNGYFDYEQSEPDANGKVTHYIYNKDDHTSPLATMVTDEGEVGFQKPEVDKAYLDIQGGTIDYAYGGGNDATVKKTTVIHVDNPTDAVTHIWVDDKHEEVTAGTAGAIDLLSDLRLREMDINNVFSFVESDEFHIGRLFGGNNSAEMSIMPSWNLQRGKIRTVYSGGNKGDMTSSKGLLLEIDPVDKTALTIDNVYGGCRMADVKPTVNGVYRPIPRGILGEGYQFPGELSARVLIRGGDINNVYGGNDVTGTVFGGNAVGIYTSVRGDVYGGGNGAYAYYTGDESLKKNEKYGDLYFEDTGNTLDALSAFRPNAEQVSIRLWGESEANPTIIHGSVYVGGNCATLKTKKENALVEVKMGSHVIADKVFLGNNGEKMVDPDILAHYAGQVPEFNKSFDLTDKSVFADYMEGVAMTLQPEIVFDDVNNGDPANYEENSSKIGSLYLGGNVGSMAIAGKNSYPIKHKLIIFDKLVGGCNNAFIPAQEGLNAAYYGGVIGTKDEREDYTEGGKIKDRIEIGLSNLTIEPRRWNDVFTAITDADLDDGKLKAGEVYYATKLRTSQFIADGTEPVDEDHTYYKLTTVGNQLEWNTVKYDADEDGFVRVANNAVDDDTRLLGCNVYGGCYNSGHVNGNVIININEDMIDRDEIFGSGTCTDGKDKSGVEFENQRDDVMALAMTVFGAGYGEETEIWGSTTINLNKGYAFQVFGGGERGVVGKRENDEFGNPAVDKDGKYIYVFDPAYSTTVNLNGNIPIYSSDGQDSELAETEYIYGGGNEGDVCGNTYVNLGNGRIYDAFGGASDADILGHTEMYIGRQPNGTNGYKEGFPWIRDIVYGGNDFGGTIHGRFEDGYDFTKRVRDYDTYKQMIHGYKSGEIPEVLKGTSYVEYLQGRVDTIFGGSYGNYDYTNTRLYGEDCAMPVQNSAYVNFRPNTNSNNAVLGIFGAGTGYPHNRADDKAQNRSYVLIDIPDGVTKYDGTEVFGAGSYNGLGMGFSPSTTFAPKWDLDQASAIIDLLHGQIQNVYGGSYNEGITRRTVVNVPEGSTIKVNSIYGGAYGTQILPPCDVYESNVNYRSNNENAQVSGAIYGGNNNERRTLYTHVNISAPVWSNKEAGFTASVYGAGRGIDTWSEYTEVNLESGARVYKVFGGGEMGHVLNAESVEQYMWLYRNGPSSQISSQDPYWKKQTGIWETVDGVEVLKPVYRDRWAANWKDAWTIGEYYSPDVTTWKNYASNESTNISRVTERSELKDDKTAALLHGKKYNTHVIIQKGATVDGYAYGGGLGDASEERTGDVYGSTYIALLGGTVARDIYAAGQAGGLDNLFGADFTASANAYIEGGMARNVYGGGYLGHVGYHNGDITTDFSGDRPAEANVVIGKVGTTDFYNGNPAILRNAYAGGEGGSVYGTSTITMNNGMIGYRYKNTGTETTPKYEYVEELTDKKPNDIVDAGCIFGGGYVVNSYVDIANVNMFGGTVRGSIFGGGEIGPIGRGTMKAGTYTTGLQNGDARIFKAGETHVKMYNGLVKRNVFGGGRGKDSWGGDGTMYMTVDLSTLDLACKGFVFGQTDVNIYGGEIGTKEGMEQEKVTRQQVGNVFGGGDEGSVYSAYELNNKLYIGKKPTGSKRYDKADEGYYYKYDGSSFVNDAGDELGSGAEKHLTEDCHVLVEPWLQVKNTAINYGGKTYAVGDYVPTSYLNTLGKKDKETGVWAEGWENLDAGSKVGDKFVERGVIIHNAVFAGGNIGIGSEMYANTNTVFGNATATIHDVYNRDLITIGTGHTGGLYGDGNLTLVDGYRELNITNYGTDYHNIKDEIGYSDYEQLPPREQDYYEIKYKCIQECTDNEGTTYKAGSSLPKDELLVLFEGNNTIIGTDGEPNTAYWTQNGVVSRYAGRIMNTIQRADFCGVFGSRMVMKGAKDRVPETEDKTNYTINRVREVSLNLKSSAVPNDNSDYKTHGNYFGIYSVVNYLGALTSDVDFYDAVRYTDNKDTDKYKTAANGKNYGVSTFYDWKKEYAKDPRRNNGISHNQVALASGVYLELTTEESTGKTLDEKVWGPITGVVELDLINVSNGIGGGFVYAKNIHGVRESTNKTQTLLTAMNLAGDGNQRAATNKSWKYVETDNTATNTQETWQTSGNFVHNTLVIIDDCHNESNRYLMSDSKRVPAHKWYIRGTVYYYDRYITANTGNPNAYSETVALPITISAASHNKMKLLDVQPNLYAYYSSYNASTQTPLSGEQKLVINDVEYELNTPISYWDWSQLPKSEQNLFVNDTYLTTDACIVGTGTSKESHPEGYVMLPSEYDRLLAKAIEIDLTPDDKINNPVKVVQKVIVDEEGNDVPVTDKDGNPVYVPFTSVFHSSNNISHTTGYILTHELSNPGLWSTWYTKIESATHEKQQESSTDYEDAPTYHLNPAKLDEGQTGKVLGQREYSVSDIIPEKVYTDYAGVDANGNGTIDEGETKGLLQNYPTAIPSGQAEFEAAYVVTSECSSATHHYYPGAAVSKTVGTSAGVIAEQAYVCTGSIQLAPDKYIFINELMTAGQKAKLITDYPTYASEINKLVVPAYYCIEDGYYGGNYYQSGMNYRALETFSSMSEADRDYFEFNYDALDLLIDPTYGTKDAHGNVTNQGKKYQYDSKAATLTGAEANLARYSLDTPLDYTATYDGTSMTVSSAINVTHSNGTKGNNVTTIVNGDVLDDDVYESLINERYHYTPIDATAGTTYYIVNSPFYHKEPYTVGQLIEKEAYDALPHSDGEGQLNLQQYVTPLTFTAAGTYYYCRDEYTIATGGTPVKAVGTDGVLTGDAKEAGATVPVGFIISKDGTGQGNYYQYGYQSLKNEQAGFTIHGVTPTETITFFVNREANYDDVTSEKIITVVYQYDYEESDESGMHITPISERHVVRIHITFENGIPVVDDITEPDIVLPGQSITMRVPGADSDDEIIKGGWELYANKNDAESHIKFKDYTNKEEPLYWYQDGFYIAYYAQTFNRKAYSNAVPVHVANYHDLKKVMDDKENHLHVDYDRTRLKRDSKIYINDYSGSSENGLDLLKDLYDLSLITTAPATGTRLEGHSLLNNSTAEGTNIYDGSTNVKGVRAGTNLEFFLRTDIDHGPTTKPDPEHEGETITENHPWTPIGTDDDCFKGNLHGDGHTISGLDHSLFYNLCGSVYNLGVTGTFNTAGVVDKGTGYVESAWVKTDATTPQETKPFAVFGDPSDTDGYQVVNSYFWDGNKALYDTNTDDTSGGSCGKATAMPEKSFYNGELAYDLNNFYLYKRYNDKIVTQGEGKVGYHYFTIGDDNELVFQPMKYYDSKPALCSSGYIDNKKIGLAYVEDRFEDGDFMYAAGEIPTTPEERYHVETTTDANGDVKIVESATGYFPIWPDDYIFFGQKLTFGHASGHQEVPTAVARDGGRLAQNANANRVYRAPAYYRSKVMGVTHFNPNVYLAAKEKLTDQQIEDGVTPRDAYPNMTAIDFAGHNGTNEITGTYGLGTVNNLFYPPLLDDDGLLSITNCDETKNLLVYAPAETSESGYANKQTYDVLTEYFGNTEPKYSDYYKDPDGYRLVEEFTSSTINGHLVQSDLTATNDHLLVDKQDFNAPIGYKFDSEHLMWYQRKPADNEYVDRTKGWQGISLPFTAELVTTSQKGEITHFYSGSYDKFNNDQPVKDGTTTKVGHEYWLRTLETITEKSGVVVANFTYPAASGKAKKVTNHFLWDYYYKNEDVHDQKDANRDKYQHYYENDRTYASYPLLSADTPYLLGLPGQTYYEFDLSGKFQAENTFVAIDKLIKQAITFASDKGESIKVSDEETKKHQVTKTVGGIDYTFKPSYMNEVINGSTDNGYLLDAFGDSYDKVGTATTGSVSAFRPFFMAAPASVGGSREVTRTIVFTNNGGEISMPHDYERIDDQGMLAISAESHKIVVTSTLKYTTDVRILNTGGQTLAKFTIKSGETIETRILNAGVYIVQDEERKYTKKLAVE